MNRLPPLVGPAGPLDEAERHRYARHLALPEVGGTGQRRLKNARVLVVGAGGLGSPALLYLAAAGVGTIGVVDDDVVDVSNLQRQVVHGVADLGRAKVDSAADTVAGINPLVRVVRHRTRLDASNATDVLRDHDLVLDGTDTFASRYLIGDACTLLGLPCVWGSVQGFDGQVSLFWSDPPAGPDGPVAGVTYRDLHPEPPAPGLVPNCAEGGVLGVLCAAVGAAMAAEAVKLICGIGEPLLGRVLVHDALAASWRSVGVRAAPGPRGPVDLTARPEVCAPPGPEVVTAAELAGWLAARERGEVRFLLLDVREPAEHAAGAVPGAVSLPIAGFRTGAALDELDALLAGLPPSGPGGPPRVVLHCATGGRSAEALGLLRAAGRAAGRSDAAHLDGGLRAWRAAVEVDPAGRG